MKKSAARKDSSGYKSSYESSLSRIEQAKQEEAARLSAEWSESESAGQPRPCPKCGKLFSPKSRSVARTVLTKVGAVTYRRHYHYCDYCRFGFYPRDAELGLSDEDLTDDVLALALDFAVNETFRFAAERLELHHGVRLSTTKMQHLFERQSAPLADGETPRPVVPLPLTPRNAHQPVLIENDGSMFRRLDCWHEAKLMRLGVVGETQSTFLAETLKTDRFEQWLRESPGYFRLRERTVLWLGDGAPYNWGLQQRLCPRAHALVDYWHVMEHVHDCGKELFGEGDECAKLFAEAAARLLLRSRSKQLIKELNQCLALTPVGKRGESKRQALKKLAGYLRKNITRLNYALFLRNKWPIGSGAIESAHRWVLQKRIKQAGMKWSAENGQRMAVARALYASVGPHKFYEYLEKSHRLAA